MAYFWIRSRLNGLVLDVEGGNRNPGARVIMWSQKPGMDDNQLWYEDHSTGTIRSKLNGFCLDLAGDTLILQPYYPGNSNQQWFRSDPCIQSRSSGRVLDIANNNQSQGAHLIAWNRHGGPNQSFDFQFASGGGGYPPPSGPSYPSYPSPAPPPSYPPASYPPPSSSYPPAAAVPGRHFFLVSEHNGKVLDIEGGKRLPGADLIVWPRKPNCRNQLWYIDRQGFLRSSLNDFAPEARMNGEQVRMMPVIGLQANPGQRFTVQGNRIANSSNPNECFDISGASHNDGAKVILYQYRGGSNQHWRVEYV